MDSFSTLEILLDRLEDEAARSADPKARFQLDGVFSEPQLYTHLSLNKYMVNSGRRQMGKLLSAFTRVNKGPLFSLKELVTFQFFTSDPRGVSAKIGEIKALPADFFNRLFMDFEALKPAMDSEPEWEAACKWFVTCAAVFVDPRDVRRLNPRITTDQVFRDSLLDNPLVNAEWLLENYDLTEMAEVGNDPRDPRVCKILSRFRHISPEYVLENPDLPWDWSWDGLVLARSLTIDVVLQNLDKDIDFDELTSSNWITLSDIKNNPQLPWSAREMMWRRDITRDEIMRLLAGEKFKLTYTDKTGLLFTLGRRKWIDLETIKALSDDLVKDVKCYAEAQNIGFSDFYMSTGACEYIEELYGSIAPSAWLKCWDFTLVNTDRCGEYTLNDLCKCDFSYSDQVIMDEFIRSAGFPRDVQESILRFTCANDSDP